jgi:pSer/pThr/pTyr-binding forkhead associated (FHA) protein
LRAAGDATLALPSLNVLGIPGTVALPGVSPGQLGTSLLVPGAARGTRVLSIGLPAEAALAALPAARLMRAELEHAGRLIALHAPVVRLGQAPECEVRVPGPGVAQIHAEIARSADSLYLRDIGSRGGTWLNEQAVNAAHKLYDGDKIRIGSSELALRAPDLPRRPLPRAAAAQPSAPRLELCSGSVRGLCFALAEDPRLIGRAPECAIRIDELGVSPRHASIRGAGGAHWLSDLQSELGTYLGQQRLHPGQEQALEEGARLRFGSVDAVYTRAPRAPLSTLLLRPAGRLVVHSGAEQGRAVALGLRAVVGSERGADLQVSGLAAQQLEVAADQRGFWVRDLAGGMFCAGAPLGREFRALTHGDLLLGPAGTMLRFEEGE